MFLYWREKVFKWGKNILDRVLLPKEVFLKYFKIFVSKGLFRNEIFFFPIFWVESDYFDFNSGEIVSSMIDCVCIYIY